MLGCMKAATEDDPGPEDPNKFGCCFKNVWKWLFSLSGCFSSSKLMALGYLASAIAAMLWPVLQNSHRETAYYGAVTTAVLMSLIAYPSIKSVVGLQQQIMDLKKNLHSLHTEQETFREKIQDVNALNRFLAKDVKAFARDNRTLKRQHKVWSLCVSAFCLRILLRNLFANSIAKSPCEFCCEIPL